MKDIEDENAVLIWAREILPAPRFAEIREEMTDIRDELILAQAAKSAKREHETLKNTNLTNLPMSEA